VVKKFVPGENGNYMDYYQGVYEAIANNAPNPVVPEDAIRVVEVIEAAFQSSETGKVVTLPA
jgi:predicted dehydrogenase